MIPCYNARRTLPLALASLVAQTHTDWECILVDDGSTDRPVEVVEALNDPRVRFVRFEENRGRGPARQQALDLARGDYLCMVDADDWIYPWKLESQLEVMEAESELAVLSTGMAIVDAANEIVGVRIRGSKSTGVCRYPPLQVVKQLPIAHAPSIIRMNTAKHTRYDPRFRLGEDSDYLLSILRHHTYAILNKVTYAYSEIESVDKEKMVQSLHHSRLMFYKYRQVSPGAAYGNMAALILKEIAYRLAFAAGFGKMLIASRSAKPSDELVQEFYVAKQRVFQAKAAGFGSCTLTENRN
jgi:glycosyltransferase involved in cell wall biosynthesis